MSELYFPKVCHTHMLFILLSGEGEALKIREVASMNSDPEMNGVELYVAGLSQYRVSLMIYALFEGNSHVQDP